MDNVTFDEFKKLELKVGEIRSAEEIVGADKLYKIKVDLGGEERELDLPELLSILFS
jgi:methionyl-tRNA synthetase